MSFLFLIIIVGVIHHNLCERDYYLVKKLHEDLFRNYNPNVKPLTSQNTQIEVDVKLYLLSIYEVHEKSHSITGDVYWDITWSDGLMRWNESEYSDTDHIYVPTEKIWMPDIIVSNGVGASKYLHHNIRTDHVSILSDGTVGWWPTGDVTIQCEVVLTKFPFDTQF